MNLHLKFGANSEQLSAMNHDSLIGVFINGS